MEGLFFLYPFILFILSYCPAFEVMQGKEQDSVSVNEILQ